MGATIYIPTYRRTKQLTWDYLSPEWRERTFLVCDDQDADRLEAAGYPVLRCPAKGIGPTRQWILEQHDVEARGSHAIMMDDDLRFARRRTDEPKRFLTLKKDGTDSEWFNRMMALLLNLAEKVPLAGLVNRGGANFKPEPIQLDTRLHDLLVVHVPTFREEGIRFDRVEFMEDFDVALQFLAKGYHTGAIGSFCKDDEGANINGGCSEYRTAEGQNAAALDLYSSFPTVVRLVQKATWETMGVRTDVQVQWKKAYKEGKQNREILGLQPIPEPDLSEFDLL